jgi:sec-independent protein translocase protein TatA
MDIGVPELLIVLVVVLLLFGPGRISKTAGELGKGLKSFRDGLSGKEDEAKPEPAPHNPDNPDEPKSAS